MVHILTIGYNLHIGLGLFSSYLPQKMGWVDLILCKKNQVTSLPAYKMEKSKKIKIDRNVQKLLY
jgi:hypothetical protein